MARGNEPHLVERHEAHGLLAQEGEAQVEEVRVGEVADEPAPNPVIGKPLSLLWRNYSHLEWYVTEGPGFKSPKDTDPTKYLLIRERMFKFFVYYMS